MKYRTPYAHLMPPLSAEDFAALKQSIETEGVRRPIRIDKNGVVLDGHHRLKCDPNAPMEIIEGADEWSEPRRQAFVYGENLKRRQLSPDQRAELDAKRKEVAAALSAEGWTQKQIGAWLGAAQQRVCDWLDINSTGSGSANKKPARDQRVVVQKDEYETIAVRVGAGESQAQVAADFGISQGRVSQIVQAVASQRERDNAKENARQTEIESLGRNATPDAILAIRNSPLIVLSPPWYKPGGPAVHNEEVGEKGAWNLGDRLDPTGAFVIFRTLAIEGAIDRAFHLRDRWKLSPLGWCIPVTGMNRFADCATDILVVSTIGNPQIPVKLPKRADEVRCPAAGILTLIYSWFAEFLAAKGTANLAIEIGGAEKHKHFQLLPIRELEAAAA